MGCLSLRTETTLLVVPRSIPRMVGGQISPVIRHSLHHPILPELARHTAPSGQSIKFSLQFVHQWMAGIWPVSRLLLGGYCLGQRFVHVEQ
jgi:hypothetical protein